jgi:anti-anti-sigma factor
MYGSIIENNKLIFTFPVKIDHNVCSEIEKGIEKRIHEHNLPVVFDLKNVNHIVSSFLGICNRVHNDVGADKFFIINTAPPVYEIFNITRLNTLFNISLQIEDDNSDERI